MRTRKLTKRIVKNKYQCKSCGCRTVKEYCVGVGKMLKCEKCGNKWSDKK
jgi:hypothetical protein